MLGLANVPYLGSATVANYTSTGTSGGLDIGTLTVTNSGTLVASVALLGNYGTGSLDFIANSDGHGGTTITDRPVTVAADQAGFPVAPKYA